MAATYLNQINIVPKGFEETMKSLGKLSPDLKKAVQETVRKGIDYADQEIIELIVERYAITEASLMDQSRRYGKWRSIPRYPKGSSLKGGIQVKGTRMPVMRFSVTPSTVPNQRGIPVSGRTPIEVRIVKKGRAQIGKPNVFLAKMRSGHIGVWRRKIPNPGGPRKMRRDGQPTQLPIVEEFMISVPEMLDSKEIRKKFEANLDKYVVQMFLSELKQVSVKAWARAWFFTTF